MSTRKLIALAMGLALVILLAGGIQLVLLSKQDTTQVEALALGQAAPVGQDQVAVVDAQVNGGIVTITASLSGPGDLTALAKDRFLLRAGTRAVGVVINRSSCQQTGTQARCQVVFDAGSANLDGAFVVYRDAKATWSLAAPTTTVAK